MPVRVLEDWDNTEYVHILGVSNLHPLFVVVVVVVVVLFLFCFVCCICYRFKINALFNHFACLDIILEL